MRTRWKYRIDVYCTSNLISVKPNKRKPESRMFEAYMLVNVV